MSAKPGAGHLARLEERADETATQIAGTQNLDVRLARLEERADEAATHMAGNRKQSLEQTEQIAAQLAGHEQNLTELSDRLSLIKQTIDGATYETKTLIILLKPSAPVSSILNNAWRNCFRVRCLEKKHSRT